MQRPLDSLSSISKVQWSHRLGFSRQRQQDISGISKNYLSVSYILAWRVLISEECKLIISANSAFKRYYQQGGQRKKSRERIFVRNKWPVSTYIWMPNSTILIFINACVFPCNNLLYLIIILMLKVSQATGGNSTMWILMLWVPKG